MGHESMGTWWRELTLGHVPPRKEEEEEEEKEKENSTRSWAKNKQGDTR